MNVNTDCNLCFVSKLNQQWCATYGNDANRNLLGQCDKVILTNKGSLVLINKNRQEIWSNRSSQLSLTSYQQNSNRINPSNNQSLSNQNKFILLDDTEVVQNIQLVDMAYISYGASYSRW